MQFSGKDFDLKLEENSNKFKFQRTMWPNFSDPETSLQSFEKSNFVVVVVVFAVVKYPHRTIAFQELLCRKVS